MKSAYVVAPFAVALTAVTASFLALASVAQASELRWQGACTASEKWGPEPSSRPAAEIDKLILARNTPAHAFAQGLGIQKNGSTNELRWFGRYLQSRALLQAGVTTAAFEGFADIASSAPDASIASVQEASIECLNRIHEKFPALTLPDSVSARLPAHFALEGQTDASRGALREYATTLLSDELGSGRPESETRTVISLLAGSDLYEAYAQGLASSAHGDHAKTIESFERLLSKDSAIPHPLRRQLNHVRLLLARAYYSTGRYNDALAIYKKVDRNSNEVAEMLSEAGWADLMAGHYADAIGDATSLQIAGMKETFAPEAPMVMAMSLNELCQFPHALKAIQGFRQNYLASYKWLKAWSTAPASSRQPLYPLAIGYVRREGDVPNRVGTEWIRSNIFLSHQDEIHHLNRELKLAEAMDQKGVDEQANLLDDIHDLAAEMNVGIRDEKERGLQIYVGGPVAVGKAAFMGNLRQMVAQYNRLRDGQEAWKAIFAKLDLDSPSIRQRLTDEINADLAYRSLRMVSQLEEVAENTRMIEVEIYNGASHDMIWLNAHPGYKDMAKQMAEEARQPASRVWNWGRIKTAPGSHVELWEDELGSFKANVFDNCSSKDKYLALMTRKK